jgi:hypothetical protein
MDVRDGHRHQQVAAQFAAENFPMIDRSESDLIAREQRNRGEGDPRTRRFGARAVHDTTRAQRVEPTVGQPIKKTDPKATP